MRLCMCFFFLLSAMACPMALAAPELESVTICKVVVGDPPKPVDVTDKFSTDTPAIHAVATIKGCKAGTKVTGVWISVDAISTPNFKIGELDVVCKKEGVNHAQFDLSKPTKGWPLGNYKLDVYIDGKPFGSAPFRVQ